MKPFIILVAVLLSACSPKHPKDFTSEIKNKLFKSTVSVTNLQQTSGGSGTILVSYPHISTVLTNGHVCEVVKNGGLVNTSDQTSHIIAAVREYALNDLCLVYVMDDLHVSTELAAVNTKNNEKVLVSGHPQLLPTLQTEGHFAGKKLIQVIIGYKPCDRSQAKDILCMLLGVEQIVKTYQAGVLSALIQPGSSGSGVFNTDGELVGVIFAGSGQLSFGFTVTLEYVKDFILNQNLYDLHSVDYTLRTDE